MSHPFDTSARAHDAFPATSSHAERIRAFLTESTPGEFVMAVQGTSMAPSICEGDSLAVRRVGANSLRLGDVAVFYPDEWNIPCVHRIIWKRRRDGRLLLYAKGDARSSIEMFEENALVGRVEEVRREERAIGRWRRANVLRVLWGCGVFFLVRALHRAWRRISGGSKRENA